MREKQHYFMVIHVWKFYTSHLINLIACDGGPDFVSALLNAGALLNITDNSGQTALDYGTEKFKFFVIKY
jgi:hypothetical protein